MQPLSFESISVDEINIPILEAQNIRLAVLRLDKIHPVISGNKWFKLKYYLDEAKSSGKNSVVTFGGAYSNHVVAVAAAGQLYGFETTGVIRGEQPAKLSHTLKQAIGYGMKLMFTTREQYRRKQLPSDIEPAGNICLINEGGYGIGGAKGAAEILEYCEKENYSHVVCAVGTSTMMAGLIMGNVPQQEILGIPVLKNESLEKELANLLPPGDRQKKFKMILGYHFGGYAKCSPELISFMNEFYEATLIPTDFVYTAKLFYGVMDLAKNNFFNTGSNVLVIHSGGLQGNLSLPKGTLIF
jgi:1-aminocyclopropane-1-carboxylate deaminase